jgi:hypothetical protein
MPSLIKPLQRRIDQLALWLEQHCPECDKEQAHLQDGSRERAYWMYGYLVALRDVLRRLKKGSGQKNGSGPLQ